MTGGWVDSYPDDVKASLLRGGHDLGNHSQNQQKYGVSCPIRKSGMRSCLCMKK
ncbi:MAG: hypothetical protein ACLUD0_20930 [Eubacterium ramulus]